jgi:tRNA A37 threonylcarbamoyladenosine modification protein TsaB
LPDGKPVYAVASGEALARATLQETGAASVAVVGDARRGRLWLGVFEKDGESVLLSRDWSLVTADAIPEAVPGETVLVTSEWERLEPLVADTALEGREWIRENRYPSALWVGRVAREHARRGVPPGPPTPLYLHPPV